MHACWQGRNSLSLGPGVGKCLYVNLFICLSVCFSIIFHAAFPVFLLTSLLFLYLVLFIFFHLYSSFLLFSARPGARAPPAPMVFRLSLLKRLFQFFLTCNLTHFFALLITRETIFLSKASSYSDLG